MRHTGNVFALLGLCAVAMVPMGYAQNSSVYDPINQAMFQLNPDSEMAFYLEEVLSLANNGGSNTGEVLRIATQFVAPDEESTYEAFYPVAEAIHALAESVDPRIDPTGARENYFHASTYYRGAAFFLIGNQSDPRLVSLWDQQLPDFNKAVALLKPVPAEQFTLEAKNSSIGPYEIPGYFFKAFADTHRKVPTFVIVNGYDGSQQESYHSLCVQVLARGMNCATYEGPGQPTPRRYQNIGFIPDWWTATSPVIDFLFNRTDVDTDKIVLMGDSFGGTLAPRAAAKDARISAVVALDGLYSLQQKLEEDFPDYLLSAFNSSDANEFDEIVDAITANGSLPVSTRWIFQQSLYAFNTTSAFDWFTRLGEFVMSSDIVAGIGQRPVFVAKGQDDVSTGDQANIAYNALVTQRPNGKNLTYFHEFPTALGSGEHVSIGAETQLWTEIVKWLSGIWDGYEFGNEQSD